MTKSVDKNIFNCYHKRMGSDLYALSALAKELNTALAGARIDKIQQPESDELRFFMRSAGKNVCLVASCNANVPRLHLTASKKASPMVAPNLCMLLRKYLINATVDSVGVYGADRILYIKINAKTELRDDASYYLFIEIMNRYSNIVFTNSDLIILDAVKHLPLDSAREHVIVRGVKYTPVVQPKISYLNDCFGVFDKFEGGDLRKFILDNISGFSGATATEILSRANLVEVETLLPDGRKRLEDEIKKARDLSDLRPCIIGGEVYPKIYETLTATKGEAKIFASMSEAYDALNTEIDAGVRNRARLKTLATQAHRLHARTEKNISIDLARLKECENMENYRVFGELVVNNIYKIDKGDLEVECYNYYDGTTVKIPLDPQLSPSKNSAQYYNKYNKLKRAKEFIEKKLVEDRNLLSYVCSIEEEIASLPPSASTAPIEEELASIGGGTRKSAKVKVRKEQIEPPYIYLVDGFYIYRGKNNLQNEEITFKLATSTDIWLHLKNDHGAHTVIMAEGREVPDKVIRIASEITASTKQASADVDYTARRNVKRKPGGHPGQVIYENYKTAHAKPDAHTEFLIKS